MVHAASDVVNVNLQLVYPRGGYPLIADIDKYGEIWSMVQPGATGAGLHLSPIMHTCCEMDSYNQNAPWSVYENGDMWQQPVHIQYASIMDPSTKQPYEDIAHLFGHIIGPHLAVLDAVTVAETWNWWALPPCLLRPMCDNRLIYGPCEEAFNTTIGPIHGLVPAWTVIPLGSESESVKRSILHTPDDIHSLDSCICSLGEYGDHVPVDPETMEPLYESNCEYFFGAEQCVCGKDPTDEQRYASFWYQQPCLHSSVELKDLTAYCKQQFFGGWMALYDSIANTTNDLESECFSSYWHSWSPYAGFPGLSSLPRKL